MIHINRSEYKNFLLRNKDNQLIKIISGIRGSGKTTIIEEYKKELLKSKILKSQILSIDLEKISYQNRSYKVLIKDIVRMINIDKINYIFINEIQNCLNFELLIKELYSINNVDLYLVGPHNGIFTKLFLEYFDGKYAEMKMYPLSFKEFATNINENISNEEKYRLYVKTSSFPGIFYYHDDLDVVKGYLRGKFYTIMVRDIIKQYKINDIQTLENIFYYIYDHISEKMTPKSISDDLINYGYMTNDKTVEKYLDALLNLDIIHCAKRINLKSRKLMKSQGTYYVSNLGIRYLFSSERKISELAALKNIIYMELIRHGYIVYNGIYNNNEIDFVATNNQTYYFIQVTLSSSTERYKRKLEILRNLRSDYTKIILTLEGENKDERGIKVYNAINWLLK